MQWTIKPRTVSNIVKLFGFRSLIREIWAVHPLLKGTVAGPNQGLSRGSIALTRAQSYPTMEYNPVYFRQSFFMDSWLSLFGALDINCNNSPLHAECTLSTRWDSWYSSFAMFYCSLTLWTSLFSSFQPTMYYQAALRRAFVYLALANTVIGRPALDTTRIETELVRRVRRFLCTIHHFVHSPPSYSITCDFLTEFLQGNLGSTCNIDSSDSNAAWAQTKAPSFMDSLMSQRGSGKQGSIAAVCGLLLGHHMRSQSISRALHQSTKISSRRSLHISYRQLSD